MTSQQIHHLVRMANQIAVNFGEQRNAGQAAARTREHLKKFWTRDMRRQLAEYAATGGEALSPGLQQMLAQDQHFEDTAL